MARLFKVPLFFLGVFCATLFAGAFGTGKVHAFTCTTSCQARADKVKQELSELSQAGVKTYIYWQYSGSCSNPWADSNDQYSFFQGDPLCAVFKEAAASGMTIGVNVHHLSTHIGETDQLAYLHNDCGVSIVRFWAYKNIGTGASTSRATVDAITAAGMKAIPVICDYSNTCTDLGITGTTQADPTSWYQTEYKGAYKNYALQLKNALSGASLFGIELLNEPHCGGQAACVQPYSSWASDMVTALSGFTVGIGQKASENTTRGDSPGAGSPPDFTVSNASVGMASAHYYNASEKALALTAASQAGALGKPFYIGERGVTCDGQDGEGPGGGGGGGGGIGPVQEPACEPGKYKLTVKGTIKSSNVFLQSIDVTTNETIYTDVRAASAGTAEGIPYVKNVPVDGAFVQLHDSQKIPGHVYNSGTIDGMLKQSYKMVTTKPDGTFTISAESHCGSTGNVYRDDWRGTGYEQYLTVSCADKVNGESSAHMIVKDVLGYLLDLQGVDKEIEVDLGDINVDCQAVPRKTYPGVSMPGGNVKIAQRSREVYLACSGTNRITRMALPGVTMPNRGWNMDLIFKDEWSPGSFLGFASDLLNWISGLFGGCGKNDTACWGTWLENHTPFEGRTEGRVDIQSQLYTTEEHSILIDTLLGIKESVATRPLYFLKGAPSTYNGREIETYNGYEEKPQLVDCENYRRCSQTLSDPSYPLDNMQTCGGTAFALGVPFGNVIKTATGEIDPYLSGDAVRYRELPKSRQVCVDKSTGTDVIITIADIMPPEGYCGDMDGNGRVEGGEMPCPQYFSCGDYNADGLVNPADGERECLSTPVQDVNSPDNFITPGKYKYDIRYFPYNLLYNVETTNNSEAESQTNQTADSYNNVCPHGYDSGTGYHADEGPSGDSKPANAICENVRGSFTFKQQVETKFPCTDSLCFKTNETLETTDYDVKYPLSNLLAAPKFPASTDSRAIVIQTVAQVAQDATDTVDNRGNFFRIGVPDDLCSCSLVENGANADIGLANCLGDASLGSVPKANEPANIFNPTKDQAVGKDDQIKPYITTASPTAGGADWELQKKLLATKGSQQEAHYEQSTKTFSVSTAVGYLMDAVSCAFSDSRVVNNPVGDITRDINCGRVLRTTADNTSKTRGSLPPLVSGGLALLNAFDPPFEDQTQIKTVSVVDSTMTKAELTTDGNPYGFNLSNINGAEVPGSQGSGYLINKGDYGKKVQRDKFMNLVSNPVFIGDTTPDIPPVLTESCCELTHFTPHLSF